MVHQTLSQQHGLPQGLDEPPPGLHPPFEEAPPGLGQLPGLEEPLPGLPMPPEAALHEVGRASHGLESRTLGSCEEVEALVFQ